MEKSRKKNIHINLHTVGSGLCWAQEGQQRQMNSHVCLCLSQAPCGFPSPTSCPFPSPNLSLIDPRSEKERLQTPIIPPPPPFYSWGNPTSKERWLRGCRRAERSYSTFKVRRVGREEIPLVQCKEQWLRFAGAAVKKYPTSKVRETQVRR